MCYSSSFSGRNGEVQFQVFFGTLIAHGNMCNQFFYPGFQFDFYSDRGSTADPSGRSNVRWCGLGIFLGRNGVKFSRFFPTLIAPGTKTRRAKSPDFWNNRRLSDDVFKLIENSAYVDALCH